MIAKDKLMHGAFGAAASAGAFALAKFGVIFAMLLAAVAVGVAYELVQKLRGEGQPDWRDALATAIGGAAITGAAVIVGLA
jgi:Co/Zn/Cd efflux system component